MNVEAAVPARKHPIGLPVLFFTEMWERFGFYCMLSILALYMNESLGFSTKTVGLIYGAYIALVYFTPVFGGLVADRWLGFSRSILIGAVFMAGGYFLLAFPPLPMFFAGLLCIIIGNGMFKPNISTLLGNLYHDVPEKRDAAYNIFYMGINIGAFFSPFVAAYMRNTFGWGYAFAAAGVGMIVSFVLFVALRKYTVEGENKAQVSGASGEVVLTKAQERARITALMLVFGIVIIFWMAFHQNGFTLTFWARDATATNLSPELSQAFNPFFVVAFTPLLVWFWTRLRRRSKEPSTAAKIGIGMLLTAAAFTIMTGAALSGGDTGRVSIAWLVSAYAVITLGELCLSPMGLSLVNKLAPARMRGLLMGGWFAATAIGNYLSGFVGSFWDDMPHSSFFMILVVCSVGAAGLLLLVLKRIRPTIREAEQMALSAAKKA
ncbi:MFS transporter [candidate division KSB1 bacterium]|nr:MAG: MFS transporter [candidate division KSB1 bacterium]